VPEKHSEIGKEVQSVYFDKKYFTEGNARRWVKDHKGTLKFGMDEKKNVMRFRQWPPRDCTRFYTLTSKNSDLPRGVAFVICAEKK
jgi:hypothetical protein